MLFFTGSSLFVVVLFFVFFLVCLKQMLSGQVSVISRVVMNDFFLFQRFFNFKQLQLDLQVDGCVHGPTVIFTPQLKENVVD